MKRAMLISGLLLTAISSLKADETATATALDAALAAELGADEYGMRSYVFVLLKTGPATVDDPERRRELFAGHRANIERLADRGDLVLAAPLVDGSGKRGIFVINAPSIDAAKEMVASDPAIAAGVFSAEYSTLYGSAALMQVTSIHRKLQRRAIE
jgi:uncharacterized protein YciI